MAEINQCLSLLKYVSFVPTKRFWTQEYHRPWSFGHFEKAIDSDLW